MPKSSRSTRQQFAVLGLLLALPFSAQANAPSAASSNKKPELVAQRLYEAWRVRVRPNARKVAGPEVLDKLFSVHWRAMKFRGCHVRQEGGFECIYFDARGDLSLAMIVEGGVSVGGYNVAELSFSSEG